MTEFFLMYCTVNLFILSHLLINCREWCSISARNVFFVFQDENYYKDLESKVIQLALFILNNVLIIAPNNMVSMITINISVLLFFRVLMLSHQ